MVNKKPVLTVVLRNNEKLSENELCTVVTTAIIRFIDEVDTGFTQAKHEIAVKNWDFTGQRINIRQADEDQWWNFLLEDGMTGTVGDIHFHVIPPIPHNLLSENVRYCPDKDFNIVDDFDVQSREGDIHFPLLSILVEKNKKVDILGYIHQAKDVALLNLAMTKGNFEYENWSKNNFAINVGIVDNLEYLTAPRVTLEKRRGHVNALGIWVQE